MKTAGFNVVQLPIDKLQKHPLQPDSRHQPGALRTLRDSIERDGLLSPVEVRRHRGQWYIIDGNRRVAVMRELGWSPVPCVETQSDVPFELALPCRGLGTRRYTAADHFTSWLQATDRASFLATIGSSTAALIREMVKTFGEKGAETLAQKGVSPSLTNSISITHSFLHKWDIKDVTRKQVGHWILQHNGTMLAKTLSFQGSRAQANRLASCIRTDQPFVRRKRKRTVSEST